MESVFTTKSTLVLRKERSTFVGLEYIDAHYFMKMIESNPTVRLIDNINYRIKAVVENETLDEKFVKEYCIDGDKYSNIFTLDKDNSAKSLFNLMHRYDQTLHPKAHTLLSTVHRVQHKAEFLARTADIVDYAMFIENFKLFFEKAVLIVKLREKWNLQ